MRARPRTVAPGSQVRQSSTYPAANPYTPAIPQPSENLSNLAACVSALKANVESLIGQRGEASNRAVTFNDLVNFGLLTPEAITSPTGGVEISDLRVPVITFKGINFSLLPTGASAVGKVAYIIDSNTDVWGDPIAAAVPGVPVLAFHDGTNWTVMAK